MLAYKLQIKVRFLGPFGSAEQLGVPKDAPQQTGKGAFHKPFGKTTGRNRPLAVTSHVARHCLSQAHFALMHLMGKISHSGADK